MYGSSAPVVTLPKSAAAHSWRELVFVGADDLTGIVTFEATSRHNAARVNVVSLDALTGEVHCDCKAGECGTACWHIAHVANAWAQSPAMREVLYLTDAQLGRYGKKLGTFVRTYRARTGRALAADQVNLVAARSEWRRREAVALTGAEALPIAA